MGYTHYWTFKTKPNAVAYARAIRDINKLARYKKDILSGYSAHAPVGVYGGALINGIREDSHEDFSLPGLPQDAMNPLWQGGRGGFNFCKTAMKPYDVVIVAALAILKYRLGDKIDISSDGTPKDWKEGVNLARKVTRLRIKNPLVLPRVKAKRSLEHSVSF